ncbi:MAG TPA: peroxiredoxin [Candidatus Paceibacterota bacterium]|nr:peroxiredoxin [Candidatus Paceibacterota bacterium]
MAIKLTITRHVEKKKQPPTRLVVERVTSKHITAKKAAPKKKVAAVKKVTAKKVAAKKAKVVKASVAKKVTAKKVAPKKVKTVKAKSTIANALIKEEIKHMSESVASAQPLTPGVLDVGSVFPSFALLSTEGGTTTNADLLGSRYVMYFYPKDETSGCTTEAHEFSKLAGEFGIQNVRVFGVSPDSLESHEHFIAKEGITYPLLVDEGHAFAKACGVWGGLFNKRTTFVVGPDGLIERIYRDVKPEGHGVCVLQDIAK